MKTIGTHMKNGNFYLAIAVIMMLILFISSSQTYEEQSQIGLLQYLLKNEPFRQSFEGISFIYGGSEVSIAASGYFSFVEFFVRKAAHFGTYFIVGWGLFVGTKKKTNMVVLPMFLAWLSATGYAALDEFHQMLTGGRTPLFQDVVLDSVGAATAILVTILFSLLFGHRRKAKRGRHLR